MGNKVCELFENGMATAHFSSYIFGFGLDLDYLKGLFRKDTPKELEKAKRFLISEYAEDYSDVDDPDTDEILEGLRGDCMLPNFVQIIFSEIVSGDNDLDALVYCDEYDDDVIMLGYGFGDWNQVDGLLNVAAKKDKLEKMSDVLGLKYGLYTCVGYSGDF